ncbi:MAG: hypothetical protein ABFD69_07110 [Candidatus Sumerlaeia bacterium]
MRRMMGLLMIALAVSTASASDSTMFNYQGRVMVQGMPYTGTGRMKVAILATTGTSTVASLWSNDGSSLAGSEPADSFSVNAASGVFDVMIGDTALGMQPLPAILFNRNDELKVRVWFNDGLHGFQKLSPDRRLINPRRMGVTDVYSSTTLYVNGATGDDLNSGLSPAAAKKTIQAAVDMVPARLFHNLTIDVATGTYRESVKLDGIVVADGYNLTVLGDKTTVPTETVSPIVRLTGTNNDTTHEKVRQNGLKVSGCRNVEIKGFLVDYFIDSGVSALDSNICLNRCKTSYNNYGVSCYGGKGAISNSWATYNYCGFLGLPRSEIMLGDSGASNNSEFGLLSQGYCNWLLGGKTYFKNSRFGIALQNSYLWVDSGVSSTPYIQNNTWGIQVYYHSSTRNLGAVTYSGNTTNLNVAADSYVN